MSMDRINEAEKSRNSNNGSLFDLKKLKKKYKIFGNKSSDMTFDDFVQRVYSEIPEQPLTVSDNQKVILAKVSIINHPKCPKDFKKTLFKEISVLNNEISRMDKSKSYDMDFDDFVQQAYNKLPDQSATVDGKQKVILAKVSILDHPDCPLETKKILFREISRLSREIRQIKSKINKNV